jgi:hypothetical protein
MDLKKKEYTNKEVDYAWFYFSKIQVTQYFSHKLNIKLTHITNLIKS